MPRKTRLAVWPLALLLASCSPVTALNALAPRMGVTRATGIAYAVEPERYLDVYAPDPIAADGPVVVFFYGGGWANGSRGMYRFLGAALAARGVVVVVPDYRLYPAVRFPAFMTDAALAVAWTRDHIGGYGGDARHVFLMGHSAGAQIATLLALDTRYLKEAGVDPQAIAGVIGLSGPYDFLPLTDPVVQAVFGPEKDWPRSQPINYVTPGAPPMLLATGLDDDTVDPNNTARLAAALRRAGVHVETRTYAGAGHEITIGAFASALAPFVPSRRDTLEFIAAHHMGPS